MFLRVPAKFGHLDPGELAATSPVRNIEKPQPKTFSRTIKPQNAHKTFTKPLLLSVPTKFGPLDVGQPAAIREIIILENNTKSKTLNHRARSSTQNGCKAMVHKRPHQVRPTGLGTPSRKQSKNTTWKSNRKTTLLAITVLRSQNQGS